MPQEAPPPPPDSLDGEAHPDWFREPTRQEHRFGGLLFSGFGLFFLTLFFIERHWPFRWVILVLGVASLIRGLKHLSRSLH